MRRNLIASEGGSVYLFALCGASVLQSVLSYLIAGRAGEFAGMNIGSWIAYAVNQFAIILVVVLFAVWRKYDVGEVSKIRPLTNPKRWALLVPITVVTIIAFLPLSMLFTTFLDVIGYPVGGGVSMPDYGSVGVYFLSLFLMAFLPAIGEELLMRGTVLPAMTTRGVWFGVFISAFLFSFMHGNPLQTVYQFCLGAVLAVLFLMSGSIIPCIIVHFLNNFITITMSAYLPQIDVLIAELGAFNWLTGAVSFAGGTLLLVFLLYLYHRAGKPRPKREDGGFRVVDNGVVFEEYALYAYADGARSEKSKRPKFDFRHNAVADGLRFVGSMFTKRGWRTAELELAEQGGVPYLGKQQPMINVWLAIGFATLWWMVTFISGLLV